MKYGRLLVFLVIVYITGCAGMKAQERTMRLDTAIQSYGAALRWARYNDAYAYHLGKDGYRPTIHLDDFEGIRVTAYKILEKTLNDDGMEATIVAKISFYNDETGTVTDIKHIQNWWYREEGRLWLVDAAFPKFRQDPAPQLSH